MLLSRLFEKVLGRVLLPAKSGKDENSIEKDTKASRGTPAPDGGAAVTEMVEPCLGGLAGAACEAQSAVKPSNETKEIQAMSECVTRQESTATFSQRVAIVTAFDIALKPSEVIKT